MSSILQTDILIAGAGPAGASLAAFLGQNGLKGLVIAKDSSTAYTPRAHGFNPFALECLRDIDLEDEALRLAIRGPHALSMRFARSLAGEEYGRVSAWLEKPEVAGKIHEITPCEYVDLTQRHLEPLLVRYASHHGFNVRHSTELKAIEPITGDRDQAGFLCTVYDHITQQTFQIRTKYLFGADGGRSTVARSLDFNFNSKPGGVKACNVLLRADLAKYMPKERQAALSWIAKPDNKVFPGIVGHLRAVRPWNEWVMAAFGPGGSNPFEGLTTDSPELVACVREFVGDDTVEVEILAIDPWTVRESVADEYSKTGLDVYILGDAAHRHPPAYGLGSNTCVQDAYNLAWKTAFVQKGIAGHGLLNTFSQERQPVGADLVRESNDQLRAFNDIWEVLGMRASSPEAGVKEIAELAQPSGSARREKLHKALETKRQEFESVGLAHNHWYTSKAIYLDDEVEPRPILKGDPIVDVLVSTFPGSRLPHVWLDIPQRGNIKSTQDLSGKGRFCLFTGVGGDAWRDAAATIQKTHGIPIVTYGIGQGLDYIDVHRDWNRSEMTENCETKLMQVLDRILSRDEL
ncbi:FAD binding domain-containing protein [Diaporthe sp. PMI_573]|nr:FAD binding domain-containing protein [Diaporthaceae sp. PMI_573]